MSASLNKGNNIHSLDAYRPSGRVVPVPAQTRSQWASTSVDDKQIVIEKSRWIEELLPKFEELMRLPVGWDGYSGLPVSFQCVCFALQLIASLSTAEIEAPQVVPGSDGSLQLEWHNYGYDVELNILALFEVVAFRKNVNTGAIEELDLTMDYKTVYSWMIDMRNASTDAYVNTRIAL